MSDYKITDFKVTYSDGAAHIDNRDAVTNEMAKKHPHTLAELIKEDYKAKMGKELKISTESLSAEIKAHVDLYNLGIEKDHTCVADCGETDKERSVWDIAASVGYGQANTILKKK